MLQPEHRLYSEDTPLGRLQNIAEAYLHATPEQQQAIADLFDTEEERQAFLLFAGFHHLDRDPDFYKAIRKATAEVMYKEFTEGR